MTIRRTLRLASHATNAQRRRKGLFRISFSLYLVFARIITNRTFSCALVLAMNQAIFGILLG